jgi:hypothetical protein
MHTAVTNTTAGGGTFDSSEGMPHPTRVRAREVSDHSSRAEYAMLLARTWPRLEVEQAKCATPSASLCRSRRLRVMHVVELAVSDTRLVAAVAQAPLTAGLAAAMMSPLKNGIRLFGLALLDRLG